MMRMKRKCEMMVDKHGRENKVKEMQWLNFFNVSLFSVIFILNFFFFI